MLKWKQASLGIALVLMLPILPLSNAHADGIKDFVLSQLDGKGTVDSIDVAQNTIVIDDATYQLARSATVFNVNTKTQSSISDIQVGSTVGFKAKPLPKPTAPYDQSIIKLWILP